MPIIIKTIGVQVYGGYSILVTIVGFIIGISSLGVGFRCNRFLPSAPDPETCRALFYPQFIFRFASLMLLSLVLIWSYPTLDKLLFKGDVKFSIGLVLPYFIFYFMYSQTTDYFRYTHRIGFFSLATLSYACFNIAFILILFSLAYKLTINVLFILQIISAVLVAIPLTLKMVREIGFTVTLPNIPQLVKDIKLGFPLVMVYLVDFILNSSDRYVVTAFISVTAVGYYNSAYAMGSFIALLPRITGVVLPPLLSKAVDTANEVEARHMVNYTVKGFLMMAIPFVVGSAVMSKSLLTLLANAEVAANAFLVTPIVALGTLFYGLNIILSNVLFVRLKTKVILKMNAIAAIMNLGLNILIFYFLPNILVAAVTTLLSYVVAFIFIYRVTATEWPIDFDLTIILKSVTASLCMGMVLIWISSRLVHGSPGLSFVMGEIVVGIIIYCLIILLLRTFSVTEWRKLKEIIGKGER